MRIGFMGRTKILADTLDLVKKSGQHQISFIWTSKDEAFYEYDYRNFESISQSIGCPFIFEPSANGVVDVPAADVVISINFVNIIPESFLNKFKHGVLNAHAGDLPRYKGNACPNWAIINEEEFVRLTVHKMAKELDSGPIYSQSEFRLNEHSYIGDVYKWLSSETPKLFLQALKQIQCGAEPHNQIGRSLRVFPRKPEDGRLNFSRGVPWNYRLIRASSDPFDGAFCYLNGSEVKVVIKKAVPVDLEYDFVAVDGQIIECDPLKKNFTIASQNEALRIEDFAITTLGRDESFKLICGSLRNRLM